MYLAEGRVTLSLHQGDLRITNLSYFLSVEVAHEVIHLVVPQRLVSNLEYPIRKPPFLMIVHFISQS